MLCSVGGEPFLAFSRMGSRMVQAALAKVGWAARAEDSHTDKLLRATIIGLLPGKEKVYRRVRNHASYRLALVHRGVAIFHWVVLFLYVSWLVRVIVCGLC